MTKKPQEAPTTANTTPTLAPVAPKSTSPLPSLAEAHTAGKHVAADAPTGPLGPDPSTVKQPPKNSEKPHKLDTAPPASAVKDLIT